MEPDRDRTDDTGLLDKLLALEGRRVRSDPAERAAMTEYLRFHARRFEATLVYLDRFDLAGKAIFSQGSHPGHLEVFLKAERGFDIRGSAFGARDLAVEDWSAAQDGSLTFDNHLLDFTRDPLPFADQSLDVVLNFEMLEHLIVAPYLLLAETNRVLRPDGLLLISTPNAQHWRRLLALARGIKYPDEDYHDEAIHRHNYLYSLRKLTEVIGPFGFEVIDHSYIACIAHPDVGSTKTLDGALERAIVEVGAQDPRFAGDTLLVAARKTRDVSAAELGAGADSPPLVKTDAALRAGALEAELRALYASKSWRLTAPLRGLAAMARRLAGR